MKEGYRPTGRGLLAGSTALVCALPVALLVHAIQAHAGEHAERALPVVGTVLLAVVVLPVLLTAFNERRALAPARLALLALIGLAVGLTAVFLVRAGAVIRFPADILTWSESDFVNDILKFRVGYPLYTANVNNESFTYPPATQLLTYLLAWLCGQPTSIPFFRAVQLGFSVVAALVAFSGCRRLVALSGRLETLRDARLWHALWLPMCLLFATNPLTNGFGQNLHDDALAVLLCALAYWLLLAHVAAPSRPGLIAMALLPALGFLVKQSLLIWTPLYVLQLALFDRPRVPRRVVGFTAASVAAIIGVVATCDAVWGAPFMYWVVTVLGHHGVSPLRSLQHGLDVWPYFFVLLLGGGVLVRGRAAPTLLGPWVVAAAVLTLEAYTSGVAWMLNHMGPGSLLAGVWFLAALPRLWPRLVVQRPRFRVQAWARAGVAVLLAGLLWNGLGLIRIPTPPFSTDAYRYVAQIEQEFTGLPARQVLLDAGTWVYLAEGVVMKDRAPAIGERGYSATGDFSGILQRLHQKHYAKILVRNFHSPDFWYDHYLWQHSSGIRAAMAANYHEVRRIAKVEGQDLPGPGRYLFSEISVLAPNE